MSPKKKNYNIVFKKLSDLLPEEKEDSNFGLELSRKEMEEIDELRRFSLETKNPDNQSYTTT